MELTFTIGFIKRGHSILLLNREAPAWMGMWNGVGGKIELDETPETCILREIKEETGIVLPSVTAKGMVTWKQVDGSAAGGMYAFMAEVPEDYHYETPVRQAEGILDWKDLDWVLHPDNVGVCNLQHFLPTLLNDDEKYEHRFVYSGNDVHSVDSIKLTASVMGRY